MTDFEANLEDVRRLLDDGSTSSAAFHAGAEKARALVGALDDAIAAAPEREAEVLAALAPLQKPGIPRPASQSIAKAMARLGSLGDEDELRANLRKAAVWLAAHLDHRAREAKNAETARDEARKPLAGETRRAQQLALKFARYPALAKRAVELLIVDVKTRPLASNAYYRARHAAQSSAIGYGAVFVPPRVIAREAIMTKLVLPIIRNGGWVDSYFKRGSEQDLRNIENPNHVVDLSLVAELLELSRASSPTWEAVDRAVAMADARLVAEFAKVVAEIAELIALDASIDRSLRYVDGALVYADEMFPDWVRRMPIVLPDVGGYRAAAE